MLVSHNCSLVWSLHDYERKRNDSKLYESIKFDLDNIDLSTKADVEHSHDDLYYTETEVDALIVGVNENIDKITSGETVVKKAEEAEDANHANSADEATHAGSADEATHAGSADSATSALDAEKLGGQLPSYYAKMISVSI